MIINITNTAPIPRMLFLESLAHICYNVFTHRFGIIWFYRGVLNVRRITMSDVRTRYAPSPTGYIHIGNLRSALYEYLIAG